MCRGINCLVLVLANTLLIAISIAFLTGGLLINHNKACLKGILKDGFAFLGKLITDDINETIDGAVVLLEGLAAPVGHVFLVFGMVLFCVGAMALIGFCCRIRGMVLLYAAVIGVVLSVHTLFAVAYFIDKDIIMSPIEMAFYNLVRKYRSVHCMAMESLALTILMPALECCGYQNGSDFLQKSDFIRTDAFHGHNFMNMTYPTGCCKMQSLGTGPDQCPATWTEDNSYIHVGCRGKIAHIVNVLILCSLLAICAELAVFVLTLLHLRWSKEMEAQV